MASNASTPRRGLAAAALVVALLVAAAAAGARPAGAAPAPPPPSTVPGVGRQDDDTPDTVLPVAELLAKHCDGTPIVGDTGAAANTTGTFAGNCTLVLAVPGGELTWGAGCQATIDGALTIRLADGAPPPGGGTPNDDDTGEVDWDAGSAVQATSVTAAVREIDIGAGAVVVATGPAGMSLSAAAGDVDLVAGASLRATNGDIAVTASGDVDVGAGASITAPGGAVDVTAGADLDMLPGSSVAGGGDVSLRAGAEATLNIVALSSGGVLLVTAPTCEATNVSPTAPTVQVCQ